ncbi:hypothetical protein AC579_6916 [Pseudocercospora musae]|uniref:BTB domain-containing protein n=1 Tax=Pseudocercospora musae TaxID=113226 RepID=A0A139HZX4_9PEZI|nr:hypothetical protein AC579_6916 [Pseudocercospora musae]
MDSLRETSSAYYGNERFSDFTIICGEKKYKVHRCFISAHSKYFERACLSSFAEAEKQSIDLEEDLPKAVDCMIQCFYMFDYNDSIGLDYDGSAASDDGKQPDQTANLAEHHPQFSMQLNAWVYAVAE